MTLTTRLSAFFLVALALVLAGFSGTLYALAHRYLHVQAGARLEAALDTLATAAEVERNGVVWEGHERGLTLGNDGGPYAVRWTVTNETGRIVGRSANLVGQEPPRTAGPPHEQIDWQGGPWLVGRRVLNTETLPRPSAPHDDDHPKGRTEAAPTRSLVVVAAVPLGQVEDALRRLALWLAGLSGGIWLLALIGGRYLCRRALRPVRRMADAAGAIRAADTQARLPRPGTGDELDHLAVSFNALLDRLHDAFERQRRFTGDASHQLRTPLTVLLGQIEVALRQPRPAEEYQGTLAVVHAQAVRLRQIVEALLFLARADAEAQLPHLETLDLSAWLPAHLRGWASHTRAADLVTEVPLGAGPWVRAHAPLLGQLLDNLLENACKYSEPGTPVRVSVRAESGKVIVAVVDQGRGIAAEDLPHVFEPFYRSKLARREPGIGLGLAVAWRIAAALGGTLTAQSEAGKGSRLELTLPAALS
jgi:signal transduction histidine kinase